mgnify:CR=1 FL=1
MKLLMRDEAKGREHTIFVTIFSALMVMLAIVVMLMASATAISGVTLQLDKNAVDILDKQVENRAGYIQDQLQQAQELTDLSTYINETAQQIAPRRLQSIAEIGFCRQFLLIKSMLKTALAPSLLAWKHRALHITISQHIKSADGISILLSYSLQNDFHKNV